jgi:hypothetical protein
MYQPIRRLALLLVVMWWLVAGVGCGGDGGAPDARIVIPAACSPLDQAGCAAGEKCTWIRTTATEDDQVGQLGCVPVGERAVTESCTYGASGATTGYDDCGVGLVCLAPADEDRAAGSCRAICDERAAVGEAGACADGWACGGYVSFFGNGDGRAAAGVCDPTCDPLTQTRDYDGAADCGSVDGGRALGCYGTIPIFASDAAPFTCAVAAGEAVHGQDARNPPATGSVYRNGCAPGHIVGLPSSSAADAIPICSQLCEPVETHSGAPDGAAGTAAHGCPAGSECRYWWWFDDGRQASAYANTLGICLAFASYQYDADGDGRADAALPSCTSLVNSDDPGPEPGESPTEPDLTAEHLEFGCGPAPTDAKARRRGAPTAPFAVPADVRPVLPALP